MAGVHLLHVPVELAEVFLPGGEVFLRAEHGDAHNAKAHCRHGHGGERHAPLGDEHHDQAAHKLGGGAYHAGQAVGQSLLQGTHVVRHTAEDVAEGHGVEVAHRHHVYLAREVAAEVPRELQRNGGHDIVLNIGQHGADKVYYQQLDANLAYGGEIYLRKQRVGDYVGDVAEHAGPYYGQDCARRSKQQ